MVGQHMAQRVISGKELQPMSVRTSAWAVYDIFDTADGEQVFVGVVSDTQWRLLCEAFSLASFADDRSLDSNTERVKRREHILPVVRSAFALLTKAELMDKLDKTGLPFAPIATPSDLFEDVHLNASGGLLELSLEDGKHVKLPGLPVDMGGRRLAVRHDLPREGEHSAETLLNAGFTEQEVEKMVANGIIRLAT
jgi:crotonobetainyl-CoA:carnitine CoA-transferase CaiB-like acyl-CoA transferase